MQGDIDERILKKITLVKMLLSDAKVDAEYCSPNYVAEFAYNRGIRLSCNEVVLISDEYTGDE